MRPATLPPPPPSPPLELKAATPPSYLRAMLTRPLNIGLGVLAGILALLAGIPYGAAGAALPLLLYVSGNLVASLYLPSSPVFRERADRRWKYHRRLLATGHLQREIARRARDRDPRWQVHSRLRERIHSLGEMLRHRQSVIAPRDIDRLEDAAVDFLGLWLADLVMVERQKSVDEDEVQRRIAAIDARLAVGEGPEQRSLQRARADLEELRIRHVRLASRKAAIEAALLSLPDAVEEVYHAVVSTPASGDGGERLREAIQRLRLEEELEASYGDEIRDLLPRRAVQGAMPAAQPAGH